MLHWPGPTVTSSGRFARAALGVVLLVTCQTASDWIIPDVVAPPVDIVLAREMNLVEARVPARATLESLLRQNALSSEMTMAIVEAARTVFNPRNLRVDQPYRIGRTLDGLFREFRYDIDADRVLRVFFSPEKAGEPHLNAEVVSLPKDSAIAAVSAEITREQPSLIGAFDAQGEHLLLPLQLAEIFGGEIDFNSDLQQGDRFEVLFERQTREGEFLGYGPIQAAVIISGDRRLTAIRYVGPDGKPSWFDENGRSLKRKFLRSPLPFEPRVTSRFSYRRLHPIHGNVRPHLGVDFGAPTGTRVMSVGAGVVTLAGFQGGSGRIVRVRHSGGYETSYLHLSGFAKGIRPGVRVDQGDLLGYVGSSGDATGPHLDYRISKNGVFVNPLAELAKMPKGDPIAPGAREAFGLQSEQMMSQLRTLLAPAPETAPATVGGAPMAQSAAAPGKIR
jgi:murein DD-endopeptidase MepM/ murein hydrolase activator NlpD